MNPWLKIRCILKKNALCRGTTFLRFCSTNNLGKEGLSVAGKKLEDFFFNQKVQSILTKITGLDYEKIFKPAQMEIQNPVYEFVTEKRLKELQQKAHLKALKKLQMPPIMDIAKPTEEFVCKNPELQGYLESKVIFTDLSKEATNRNRVMTVRETDGTLRTATLEERYRMNQVFFPVPGRSIVIPILFESPQLDKLLDEESYIFLLDLACTQFEPDQLYYHEVISKIFNHISERKKFHDFRSTRHFGPMAFYFAVKNNIEPLLLDMVERQMISDASDTIKLLHIIHPDLETSLNFDEASNIEIVKEFIQKNTSDQKGRLELAFDSYMESQEEHTKETNPDELPKRVSV